MPLRDSQAEGWRCAVQREQDITGESTAQRGPARPHSLTLTVGKCSHFLRGPGFSAVMVLWSDTHLEAGTLVWAVTQFSHPPNKAVLAWDTHVEE